MSSNSGNLLAKFAFNIYGALNQTPSQETVSHTSLSNGSTKSKVHEAFKSNRLVYAFDKEVTTLSQLNFPLRNLNPYESEISHHVVAGGRNFLRILALNEDQSRIIQEINVLEPTNSLYSNSRVPSTNKLNNINTIKTSGDLVACGLSNGLISIYRINSNGKSKLLYKLSDHKRCINSLDFMENDSPHNLISGSQDGTIKLWDLRSTTPKPVLTILSNSHSDPIRSCQYSPHSSVRNKTTILSVHDSGALCKFDLRSSGGTYNSQNIYSPDRKWNLHTGPALSLHVHPEKEYVLTGGRDQKMCVWNYSESALTSNRVIPEHMINTYGPVMKVRWSSTHNNSANQYGEALDSLQQSMDFGNVQSNPLYNYDFACLYLNDDSTITVYNLSRKYIPKEIIKAPGNKPYQNFIWAKNLKNNRKIWTITKSNVFSSYDLDSGDSIPESDISRPLDELSTVAMAWNNDFSSMSFVNQEKYEFEITDHESIASENENLEADLEAGDYSSLSNFAPNLGVFSSSLTTSPMEKPPIMRSYTYNPMHTKSPSPIPQMRSTNMLNEPTHTQSNLSNIFRPKILRTPSQTTQDSNFSVQSPIHNSNLPQSRKHVLVNHPSPYLVPLALPLPLNDHAVFEALSSNYLVAIPDGFNLIDVCLLNANIAASVNRFRDCQIWRLLSVSLAEDSSEPHEVLDDQDLKSAQQFYPEKDEDESKSILSDIGNFVGSYNSNSTLTTNYGGNATDRKDSNSDLVKPALSSSPKEMNTKLMEHKNGSSNNIIGTINQVRGGSHGTYPLARSNTSEDLDNENLNILHNAATNTGAIPSTGKAHVGSSSPGYFSQSHHSYSNHHHSSTALGISPGQQPLMNEEFSKSELNIVQERPEPSESVTKSELTKVLHDKPASKSERPWNTENLLKNTLEYASSQGDIILSATLTILFYDVFKIITKEAGLEWLALYVDILHRKRLFVTATKIINHAPRELLNELKTIGSKEVDLRFFCCYCQKLLVNEKSKHENKDSFGYWYCDECSKRQLNCIYCHEPCKGLVVAVSLKCGHRGHFGCLKEWFITEENSECPGGCDYSL
ncbi:uncharacterized protein CANTADRAFT_28484, partial [Suhomyces tanzawaensis NRRL Y-17324]